MKDKPMPSRDGACQSADFTLVVSGMAAEAPTSGLTSVSCDP